jgi:hypothetical protein
LEKNELAFDLLIKIVRGHSHKKTNGDFGGRELL